MKFWKMSGAGNDFVLVTGPRPPRLSSLARRLCDRKAGVGADGLLYARRSGAALEVRYFNSDGSEAFCGNGSRCAAWWAASTGLLRAGRFRLRTAAGGLDAEITGPGRVRMEMPEVRGARLDLPGRWPRGVARVHFLDTGVPHAVVPVPDLERVDVETLGRALRFNAAFGPAGANVNFVRREGGRVFVRTYERGVEGETLACGTGITASAVALALAGRARPPVSLVSRSGENFRVWLKPAGAGASDVRIQGPARIVFEGEIRC